jgi:hypothetical protein
MTSLPTKKSHKHMTKKLEYNWTIKLFFRKKFKETSEIPKITYSAIVLTNSLSKSFSRFSTNFVYEIVLYIWAQDIEIGIV